MIDSAVKRYSKGRGNALLTASIGWRNRNTFAGQLLVSIDKCLATVRLAERFGMRQSASIHKPYNRGTCICWTAFAIPAAVCLRIGLWLFWGDWWHALRQLRAYWDKI